MPAPTNVDEFLTLVRKSGVVESEPLSSFISERLRSADVSPPSGPRDAAERMVRTGLLTPFQAGLLLKGKWRNFVIANKYRLLEHLGSGGMGAVYLCEHMMMRRPVAIKVLPPDRIDESARERFMREARAVAALDHPNIVRAHDIDTTQGMLFLVLEFVDGVSLQELVAERGPLPVDRACHYAAQAALGLQHAHEANLIHRDIKPANLLLDRTGTIKILDYGLARFPKDTDDQLTRKHDAGAVLGTADYLAPEQAINSSTVDIRCDIYSLGASFYYALTGHTPFGDGSLAQKLMWHQMQEPRPVRDFRPDLPPGVEVILNKLMAKKASERYREPIEAALALEPWTRTADPVPPPDELPARSSRRRRNGADTGSPSARMLLGPNSTLTRRPSVEGLSSTRLNGPSSRTDLVPPVIAGPPSGVVPRPDRPASSVTPLGVLAAVALVMVILAAAVVIVSQLFSGGRRGAAAGNTAPAVAALTTAAVTRPATRAARTAVRPTGALARPAVDKVGVGPATAYEWRVGLGAARFALHPAGTHVLVGLGDGTARSYELALRAEVRRYEAGAAKVSAVAWNADGSRVLVASEDGAVRVWNAGDSEPLATLSGHTGWVRAAAFLPDGRVVTAGQDRTLRFWDAESGGELARAEPLPGSVNELVVAPGGTGVYTACHDGVVRRHDAASGRTEYECRGHAGQVFGVAASADGKFVVSGARDGSVRVWGAADGRQLVALGGADADVWAVGVSADGRRAAACGGAEELCVWDVSAPDTPTRYRFPAREQTCCVFLPDSNLLMVSGFDGYLRALRL